MRQPFQSQKNIINLDEEMIQKNNRKNTPEYASSQGMLNKNEN